MAASNTSLPFSEQIAFFRRKLNLPTQAWTDIYETEHDWAFVVAGANRNDLVADFREAVEKAIAGGGTLEEFRRDFDQIVAKHGWDYNGGRNWRSRVIYETNLMSSYAAGRYAQLQAVKEQRPIWEYDHSDAVEHPRPLHLGWNKLRLRADDPWWKTHFPPNGWGCQCSVHALTEAEAKARGGIDQAPPLNLEKKLIGVRGENPREVEVPEGIDPGFAYAPGKSRLESAIPPERGPAAGRGSSAGAGLPNRLPDDELPPPRQFHVSDLLPEGLSEEEYARHFLEVFGATLDTPAIFTDVTGERLVIGKELFTEAATGELKSNKRGRGRYLPMLADALKNPDEIWARLEWNYARQKAMVRRRYLARYELAGRRDMSERTQGLLVFEIDNEGWLGVTAFNPPEAILAEQRIGVRLYRRGK